MHPSRHGRVVRTVTRPRAQREHRHDERDAGNDAPHELECRAQWDCFSDAANVVWAVWR